MVVVESLHGSISIIKWDDREHDVEEDRDVLAHLSIIDSLPTCREQVSTSTFPAMTYCANSSTKQHGQVAMAKSTETVN
jgi:hypothetical protein